MTSRTQKPFNHLKGIIFGIGSDGTIDRAEFNELKLWCQAHQGLCDETPYGEFFLEIKSILEIGVMTSEVIFEMNQLIKKYQPLLSPDQSPDAELHFL